MFYVPEVVNRDADGGVIEFERIVNLCTIQDLATCRDSRLLDILRQAGGALAMVHERLKLSDDKRIMLPEKWCDREQDNVFVHGDYTCANVCFDEKNQRLVIVDWSTAHFLNGIGTCGSKYFDIMWFAASVFQSMPLKCVGWWDSRAMVDSFLRGYLSVSSAGLTVRGLQHYHRIVCGWYGATFLQRTWRYPLPGRLIYCFFQALLLGHMLSYRPVSRCLSSHLGAAPPTIGA